MKSLKALENPVYLRRERDAWTNAVMLQKVKGCFKPAEISLAGDLSHCPSQQTVSHFAPFPAVHIKYFQGRGGISTEVFLLYLSVNAVAYMVQCQNSV